MAKEEVLKRIKADTPWEDVHKMADEIQKQGRVYVDNPSEAPKGVQLKRGPKGGLYYEEHGGAEKPKEERAGKSIKEYKVGQKVRDREGNVHTVLRVDERGVWTGPNTWHHPSNLSVVAQPKEEAPKGEKPKAQGNQITDEQGRHIRLLQMKKKGAIDVSEKHHWSERKEMSHEEADQLIGELEKLPDEEKPAAPKEEIKTDKNTAIKVVEVMKTFPHQEADDKDVIAKLRSVGVENPEAHIRNMIIDGRLYHSEDGKLVRTNRPRE